MKVCPKCYVQNTDEHAFCKACGQSLAEAVPISVSPPPHESVTTNPSTSISDAINESITQLKSLVKYLKFVGIGVAALILIIVAVNVFTPPKYNIASDSVSVVRTKEHTFVLFNKKEPVILEGLVHPRANSLGTAIAYLDNDALYCLQINDDAPKQIAEEVSHFSFTDNGKKIYYFKSGINFSEDLFLYELGKSPQLVVAGIDDAVISPNGKTFAYSKDGNFFIQTNKAGTVDINSESSLEYISNDGKYLYYLRNDSLFVYTKRDSNKLGDFGSLVAVSRNGNEAVYTTNRGTYISVNGKDGIKITSARSDWVGVLQPRFAVGTVKSFIGETVSTDNGIYRIGKNSDAMTKLTPNTNGSALSLDGKWIVYADLKEYLYRVRVSDKTIVPSALNPEPFYEIDITADLKHIYYTDDEDRLFYIRGNRKPKKIADDVDEIHAGFDNKTFFIVKEGELYSTKNGRSLSRVTEVKGDVISVTVNPTNVVCTTDVAIYRSVSGSKFIKIADK